MAEMVHGDQAQAPEESNHSTFLSDPAGIIQALKTLRDHRVMLRLGFEDEASSYSARILDVNDKEFLLEDIQPRSGRQLMTAGAMFSMSGRAEGIYVNSESNRIPRLAVNRGR